MSISIDDTTIAEVVAPFTFGDVFVGATQLNNPADDHAGRGRILQYDSNLNLKGLLWVEGTTHLVYGLNFAPDGVLWAHDPWAWVTLRVAPSGEQLPNRRFAQRGFSKTLFAPDGTLWFTESQRGDNQPEPLSTRLPPLPGETTKIGDGGVYRFDTAGKELEVCYPDIQGGATGSFAVTHSFLTADGEHLIYVSETGSRVMCYDLAHHRQLPDLRSHPGSFEHRFFDLTAMSGERVLASMGNRLELMTEAGEGLREYPLEGIGWSVLAPSPDEHFAYVGNWFSGQIVKLNLDSGELVAATDVAEKCMAGIAVYRL
jgi:hypothetical protein